LNKVNEFWPDFGRQPLVLKHILCQGLFDLGPQLFIKAALEIFYKNVILRGIDEEVAEVEVVGGVVNKDEDIELVVFGNGVKCTNQERPV
jgi:hypothetical protein